MMSVNRISYYSLLFCEGLLIYYITLPFYAISEQPYPFWSYLLAVILSILIGSVSLHFVKNYAVIVADFFLILLMVLFIFQFQSGAGTIYSFLMMWRIYIRNKYSDIQNHLNIIIILLVLLLIDSIFFYDDQLMIIAAIILVTLVGSYVLDHIFANKGSRPEGSLKFATALILLCLLGSVLLVMAFPLIKFIGNGILFIISQLVTLLATLLVSALGAVFDISMIQEWLESLSGNSSNRLSQLNIGNFRPDDLPAAEGADTNYNNWWLIGIGIIILIIITVLLAKKKFIKEDEESAAESVISMQLAEDAESDQKPWNFFSSFKKPNHPIRAKVLKLEQIAHKKGAGRRPNETIEEWFKRLDINPSYLDLYQKVRYGDRTITDEEIKEFQKHFEEIKSKVESNTNHH